MLRCYCREERETSVREKDRSGRGWRGWCGPSSSAALRERDRDRDRDRDRERERGREREGVRPAGAGGAGLHRAQPRQQRLQPPRPRPGRRLTTSASSPSPRPPPATTTDFSHSGDPCSARAGGGAPPAETDGRGGAEAAQGSARTRAAASPRLVPPAYPLGHRLRAGKPAPAFSALIVRSHTPGCRPVRARWPSDCATVRLGLRRHLARGSGSESLARKLPEPARCVGFVSDWAAPTGRGAALAPQAGGGVLGLPVTRGPERPGPRPGSPCC